MQGDAVAKAAKLMTGTSGILAGEEEFERRE
jgi:hypothetical protein